MLFPFVHCGSPCGGADDAGLQRRHQERKLRLLRFWRDGAERQLAALDAAISTLERQMERDRPAG
ncbi:MAG: sigma factor SigF [Cyanobacteriota bacterium]|nr:sigma factor SigF [Cyanobacteriota bacterium]